MTNQKVIEIYHNLHLVKSLGGFKLAKAVVLNMGKIEKELIEVVKETVKDKENADDYVKSIMDMESDIKFITISDEDIPGDVTVEQYNVLINFIV